MAIEGLDGSGGTTQVAALEKRLRQEGIPVHATREPSDGPVGDLVRRVLRGQVEVSDDVLPYLFAADRRDHVDREVSPHLRAGTWVVTDRYLASSLAYQSLSMPFSRVVELNGDYPVPELTVFLDLAPFVCIRRIQARGHHPEHFERLDRLEAILEKYDQALRYCERRGGSVVSVDASLSPDRVADHVWAAVDQVLLRSVNA